MPDSPPTDFLVRPAQRADLPATAALGAELVRWHHQLDRARFAILGQNLEAGYGWFLGERMRDPAAVVLVAQSGRRTRSTDRADSAERIVGYAFGQIEGPSWPDLLDTCGRFHDLYVAPDFRTRGVGAALVQAMVAALRAKGPREVVLMSAWRNTGAQRLFESLGFRPTMVEMTNTGEPARTPDVDTTAAEIIALERAALARWGQGDPSGFLEICASDVVYFDPYLDRRIDGCAALARYYEGLRGQVSIARFELLNPVVQRVGDAAVLTFNYVSFGHDGTESRWNCTEMYRRAAGEWQIIQTHWSHTATPRPR